MKRLDYIIPAAEDITALLRAGLLQASGDGEREGYGEGGDFDW